MRLELRAPHQVYKGSDGKRLPGVTTVLGGLAKPHLLGWYADMERQGVVRYLKSGLELPTRENGKVLPFAEIKRDKAADLGTVTHALCEAWLLKDTLDPAGIPADVYEQGQHGLGRFVEWWQEQGFSLLHSERVIIYDDGKRRYGGTADILAHDKSLRVVLVDLKTSKASPYWPYDEIFGQVAAYASGAENDPKVALDVERIVVARIGKEPGDVLQTKELTERERAAGWRLFCAAYDAYEAKRELAAAQK